MIGIPFAGSLVFPLKSGNFRAPSKSQGTGVKHKHTSSPIILIMNEWNLGLPSNLQITTVRCEIYNSQRQRWFGQSNGFWVLTSRPRISWEPLQMRDKAPPCRSCERTIRFDTLRRQIPRVAKVPKGSRSGPRRDPGGHG